MTAHTAQREDELVRRFLHGDDAAFDLLVEACAPRVYNLAFRMVGNAEDAQDIAQEAFLRVYDALPRFRAEAAFSTWLYRIVVNVCHDELARRRRRPRTLTEMEPEGDDQPAFTDTLTTGESSDDQLLRRERRRAVEEAVAALPEPFRTVLILYDLQGFSYQEIADILRANIGTVKSRLNRGRSLLREKMTPLRELFGLEGSPNR